jgi:hypothetical protein
MDGYIYQDRHVERDELRKDDKLRRVESPVLAIGAGLPEKNRAYVFASDSEFFEWSAGTAVAPQVRNMKRKTAEWLDKKDKHTKADDDKIWAQNQKMTRSLAKLAKETGEPITSEKLLRRWMKENSVDGERPDPFIIFDGPNLTGDSFFCCCNAPGMAQWNDRVSSIFIIDSTAMFCEHQWFAGAKFWLFGIPVWWVNLRDFDVHWGQPGVTWDNRISSYIAFPV